jgi:8-oxo-dGTP pyrophosphatase MutT (NUDIX family)
MNNTQAKSFLTQRLRDKAILICDGRPFVTEPISIVHVHLLTRTRNVVLFRRSDGFWMPISGTVEEGESFTEAAIREVAEETGLIFQEDKMFVTDHCFNGVSPKGRFLKGRTCYAVLPEFFDLTHFRFNGELTEYALCSPEEAVGILDAKGMQEAREGLDLLTRAVA